MYSHEYECKNEYKYENEISIKRENEKILNLENEKKLLEKRIQDINQSVSESQKKISNIQYEIDHPWFNLMFLNFGFTSKKLIHLIISYGPQWCTCGKFYFSPSSLPVKNNNIYCKCHRCNNLDKQVEIWKTQYDLPCVIVWDSYNIACLLIKPPHLNSHYSSLEEELFDQYKKEQIDQEKCHKDEWRIRLQKLLDNKSSDNYNFHAYLNVTDYLKFELSISESMHLRVIFSKKFGDHFPPYDTFDLGFAILPKESKITVINRKISYNNNNYLDFRLNCDGDSNNVVPTSRIYFIKNKEQTN